MLFPRFHQLDVVRKLIADSKTNGSGQKYLIEHSAGSGKSNSIAWLAYRLSSLYDPFDKKIFDSVIVITDRNVLDQQLQNTIYQFEHKTGVVQRIEVDAKQLADAITTGVSIIITTLQKFPFALNHLSEIPSRKYAVIIDEAHSSQGGEASRKMTEALVGRNISLEESEKIERDIENNTEDGDDFIREVIEKRGPQKNISLFAFTATPKQKTLEVFGSKDSVSKPQPFHLYSMRQAIEEGFILDVLKNYTTTTSDPFAVFETAKEGIRSKIAKRPNVCVLGASSYKALKNHPAILDRIKYTQHAVITPELLRNLLDFDELYIGDAVYANDSNTFLDIWSDNAVVAYVPKAKTNIPRSYFEPAFAYTIRKKANPLVDTNDEAGKVQIVRNTDIFIPKVVGAEAGYLINDTN